MREQIINIIFFTKIEPTFSFFCLGTLRVGEVVTLSESECKVKETFNNIKYNWTFEMNNLLGKSLRVLATLDNDLIEVERAWIPKGSPKKIYYFSRSALYRDGSHQRNKIISFRDHNYYVVIL